MTRAPLPPATPVALVRRSRVRVLALLALAHALVGCGSKHVDGAASPDTAPIPECDAYVASVRACMRAMGPDVAAASEPKLRELQASHRATTPAERGGLRDRCMESSRLLGEGCR